MTTFYGIPDDYKIYMYVSVGMMIGGVVSFIAFLIIQSSFMISASITTIGCGFIITSGMALSFIIKKKKDINKEINITTVIRILLIAAFALSTYFIVFSAFYMLNTEFSVTFWIVESITIPIVVVSLVIYDIILIRRRKEIEIYT